jgi:Helix-hairpin-helix motif
MVRILRYLVTAVAIVFLVVGLNNCSQAAPPETVASPGMSASPGKPASPATSTSATGSDPKININTAILSELDKLEAQTGISALSHQIQASRPYGSTEDLVAKKVLTQDQFDKVKDQITIEDIVLTGEAKDIDYLTKLGLMNGHMLVAGELLALNLPKQAEPHIGHPVEEIYVDIQDQLPERGVAEFSNVLTRVQDLVKYKPNDPQVQPEFKSAKAAIDQAIAVLPAEQRQSPAFMLQVINKLLDTAVSEYTAAISGGKITAEIEYQDSRGFVKYAKDTLFPSIAASLTQKNSSLSSDLKSKLDKLSQAWPQPVSPQTPVISADEVANQVRAIEQASMSVIRPT